MKSAALQFEMNKVAQMLQKLESESDRLTEMQFKQLIGNVQSLYAKTLVQIKNEPYLNE